MKTYYKCYHYTHDPYILYWVTGWRWNMRIPEYGVVESGICDADRHDPIQYYCVCVRESK
jgi:hypothetical protein